MRCSSGPARNDVSPEIALESHHFAAFGRANARLAGNVSDDLQVESEDTQERSGKSVLASLWVSWLFSNLDRIRP
jgi:hypothetical protein